VEEKLTRSPLFMLIYAIRLFTEEFLLAVMNSILVSSNLQLSVIICA